MHPAYTLYICLEARVAEWKNDIYATLNKAFAVPTDAWIQDMQLNEKKPLDVEERVEEGRGGLKERTEKK
ncbi:uncharacterized protein B0J16DRAFT_336547 [Fusarium flagelliforme]|uniref:uncharacterized protein n=1 Tax=Fusarium flagelliforme TaxID=2675880 RepID=UPI001E8CA3B9|nr:uncharacterized protein B0J16DRAFT_336547 [Fusarium flagelliforme]KAH7188166.1 hypothetical protein B0J16DRAFT_336547 [Fusarium flagelliforme]